MSKHRINRTLAEAARKAREGREQIAQAVEMGHNRTVVVGVIFAILFVVIAGRTVNLTLFPDGEPNYVHDQTSTQVETSRANITDRNGILLATSLPTNSLYVDSKAFMKTGENPKEAAHRLAEVLPGISPAEIAQKLTSERRFVYIRRNLSPNQVFAANNLGIPGLFFQEDERRVYPHGELAGHLVGYTDVDGRGIAGLEKQFDDMLRERDGELNLSIDIRLQALLRRELQTSITEFKAIGGAGIIMDATNGEVLAMVSLPDFDPNDPRSIQGDAMFNRASKGVYEMGSIFKVFNTAMALDAGVASISDRFDASTPIKVGRFKIRDFHPLKAKLSIPEILVHSSNIGSAHLALAVGSDVQQDYLGRLGLLRPTSLELPELGSPLLPSRWRDVNTMTISYGHGIAVSPLQLTAAIASVVNGGILNTPTLLRREDGQAAQGVRVIKQETSEQLRKLMRLVVTKGSGKNADSNFYHVGGKTGTADKQVAGRYARDARISSFVGAFPIENPRYVVLASIDEPIGNERTYNYATGGWVAAPVIKRIVDQMGPMLGIAPSTAPEPEFKPGDALYIRSNKEI